MDEDSLPFDASMALMCEDRSAPRSQWRTSSLVREIRNALGARFSDEEKQAEAIGSFGMAAAELTGRGLDADSLIRYGMVSEILGPVLGRLLINQILSGSDIDGGRRLTGVNLDGWRRLLKIPSPDSRSALTDQNAHQLLADTAPVVLYPLLSWLGHAELEDLVTLKVPDSSEFWSAAGNSRAELQLRHQYRWLVERFTETYLANWELSSLHLEYRWQKDLEPLSFPVELMADRKVPLSELQAEIAHRAVLGSEVAADSPPSTRFLMNQMRSRAVTLLRDGRRAEAATLFGFAVQQWPSDAGARNNYGFCLIPDDAQQALRHLAIAARMGYEPQVVNAYNRMCCYVQLRHPRAAVGAAEEYWESQQRESEQSKSVCPPTLWELVGDEWRLVEKDAHGALVDMAAAIASAQGWHVEEQRWRKRA